MIHRPLPEYTNQELFDIMNGNESISLRYIGAFSSEVLRRLLIEKTIKIEDDNGRKDT